MKSEFFKNVGFVILGGGIATLGFWSFNALRSKIYLDQVASVAVSVKSPLIYSFNEGGMVEETGSMYESLSPYWWVNSGGFMTVGSNIGQTVQGDLPESNKWHKLYMRENPTDTDNGSHPQNIFRLLTRSAWQNVREEAYFKIVRDNFSQSQNRNESNGILLFGRYKDSDNLYYAGLRVDGTAVIKKKLRGIYYTLDQEPFFPGKPYDRNANQSLLPKDIWVGLRIEIVNDKNGTVSVKLYTDVGKKGSWKLSAQAVDDGQSAGSAITEKGYAGIRTDFMDVDFSDYRIENL